MKGLDRARTEFLDDHYADAPVLTWEVWAMDVSRHYGDSCMIGEPKILPTAYYGLRPADGYGGQVVYIGTRWSDGEWVDDEVDDLVLSRARQVGTVMASENDVREAARKEVEKL